MEDSIVKEKKWGKKWMEISAIKGGGPGGGGRIQNVHIFLGNTSLSKYHNWRSQKQFFTVFSRWSHGWFVCQFAIWSLGFLGDSFVIAEASMFAVLDDRTGLLDDCFQ